METWEGLPVRPSIISPLETFLGGMETDDDVGNEVAGLHALKPSLVEWKLDLPLDPGRVVVP